MSFSAIEAALNREIPARPKIRNRKPDVWTIRISGWRSSRIGSNMSDRLSRLKHGAELLVHLIETDQPANQDLVRPRSAATEADVRPKNLGAGLPPLSTRGGRPSRHRQKTHSYGAWPLRSALRGRRRRLRFGRSGDRAGGGKSDKGAVQATTEGLQKDSQTACNSDQTGSAKS